MDLRKFKLGVGPMSPDVVDICLEYSMMHDFPMMIIASRNQVDAATGYSFTTKNFVQFIKTNKNYDPNRVLICRDHCGPYYSDADIGLSVEDALTNCMRTIDSDIQNNFDLIHVDISRVTSINKYDVARKLIDYILKSNPNIILEFGSEDNLSEEENKNQIGYDVEFSKQYSKNIGFVVGRTGSLTKHKQVGNFSVERNRVLAETIHMQGFIFKEHNADYLTYTDIKLRKEAGVDALNIAPQLGVACTSILTELGKEHTYEFSLFKQHVLAQETWKKWITHEVTDDETKLLVSGHYFLNTEQAMQLLKKIDKQKFILVLKSKIFEILDVYRKGLTDDNN